MSKHAIRALQIAREIELNMQELLQELDQLGEDESLSSQHRHLIMNQVTSLFDKPAKKISEYAKTFLETKVQRVSSLTVNGICLGNEKKNPLYIAGMNYDYRPVHKLELLNKDDHSWGKLIVALVEAGYAGAIQKRLTVSYFLGEKGQKALEACAGLVNCSTEGTWSITKPKAKNKSLPSDLFVSIMEASQEESEYE